MPQNGNIRATLRARNGLPPQAAQGPGQQTQHPQSAGGQNNRGSGGNVQVERQDQSSDLGHARQQDRDADLACQRIGPMT